MDEIKQQFGTNKMRPEMSDKRNSIKSYIELHRLCICEEHLVSPPFEWTIQWKKSSSSKKEDSENERETKFN